MIGTDSALRVGDWVEVRSKEEILATLDEQGRLEGMPFMPEMFTFCGQRFRVHKRAHKTCDTVFPVRGRRVDQTVHLETRCDGSGHEGCQAGCLIFWKEAWLRRVADGVKNQTVAVSAIRAPAGQPSDRRELAVWANTQTTDGRDRQPKYVCQSTQLPYATKELAWWDIRQYIEDYRSGNVGLWRIVCGFLYAMVFSLSEAGVGLGRPIRWFYDRFHALWRGSLFPRSAGTIPDADPTPVASLNLQPGELVRVKAHQEILRTLNMASKNRGMSWDAEMVPYCGGTYRVLRRVTQIIDEKTGRMIHMKNPCIMLDSVVCQGRYSYCRMFCPREIYPYFREIWLERVEGKELKPTECTSDLVSSKV